MEWFKEKGDLLALIALLLIIWTWLKTDMSTMRAEIKTDMRELRGLLITHLTVDHKGHATATQKAR